jgi:hypothetical protein
MLNPGLYPTSNDIGSAPGKGETWGKKTGGEVNGERREEISKKVSG